MTATHSTSHSNLRHFVVTYMNVEFGDVWEFTVEAPTAASIIARGRADKYRKVLTVRLKRECCPSPWDWDN